MSWSQAMSSQEGLEGALGMAVVPCGFHSLGTSLKMFSKYPLEGIQSQSVALCGICINFLGLCDKVQLTLEQHGFELCRSAYTQIFKKIFYLFSERGEGRDNKRERNIDV